MRTFLLVFGAFVFYFVISLLLCQSSFCYTQKLELREQEKLLGEDGEPYGQHFDGYNRPEDTVAFSTFSDRFCPASTLCRSICVAFLWSLWLFSGSVIPWLCHSL